jgi:hypothetical protein
MPYSWYPVAWSGMTFLRIGILLYLFCLSMIPRGRAPKNRLGVLFRKPVPTLELSSKETCWGTLFRIMPYSESSLAVSGCDGLDRSHTVTLTEGDSASMPATSTVSSNRR